MEPSMDSAFLERAAALANEHLAQLRAVLSDVQARLEPATADLRQSSRTLDELHIRLQLARGQRQPTMMLERQANQVLERQEALHAEVKALQHSQRTLEQLIRQTEMSSGVLRGDETTTNDPWREALRAQVIHGREEERLRLAREVHDGPAQVMAHVVLGMEHGLSLADQGKIERLTTHLRELRESAKLGLHEVRRFIADLRPPALDEHGLDIALHQLAERFTAGGLITVQTAGDAVPRLVNESEIVVYRIVQEALNNASKHARRARVIVQAEVRPDQVIVRVRDDGPGFDPRTVTARTKGRHWGLASMHERAELVGARLVVSSAPGQGTTVEVSVRY